MIKFDIHPKEVFAAEVGEDRALIVGKEVLRCLEAIATADLTVLEKVGAVKEIGSELILLSRPWRWWVLKGLLQHYALDRDIFWPLFLQWWSDCESNLARGWLPGTLNCARIWSSPYEFLEPDDKKFFDELPERIIVFRGKPPGRHIGIGMSWTTDREVAEWFSLRFNGTSGVLLAGHVRKASIITAIASRNESEILVFPRYVHGRIETKVSGCLWSKRPSAWGKESKPTTEPAITGDSCDPSWSHDPTSTGAE
jgi:hypothetical protein